VVNEFLKKHAEFVIDKQVEGLPAEMLSIQAANGWFKTFPHFSDMDGFSFIRLIRTQ
jgi:16S rRNA C967 or C1407 C5-methylase (RsmB/RsmF family)